MVVIGLGTAGANVARQFKKWPQYRVVTLEAGKEIPLQETVEDYEANCPRLKRKIKKIDGEVWFIVAGSAKVAGSTLAILEQIKEHKVNLMFIAADPMFLSAKARLRERVTMGVLQQYARCGLLNSIYLVSNKHVLDILDGVPFSEANDKINEAVASMIHYFNIYQKTQPLMGSKMEPKVISRIRTFAMVDAEKSLEKSFFSLDNITETCYIYNIKKTEKSNDKKIEKIKTMMQAKEKSCKTSFAMYTTEYDNSFCHAIQMTHYIQQEEQ